MSTRAKVLGESCYSELHSLALVPCGSPTSRVLPRASACVPYAGAAVELVWGWTCWENLPLWVTASLHPPLHSLNIKAECQDLAQTAEGPDSELILVLLWTDSGVTEQHLTEVSLSWSSCQAEGPDAGGNGPSPDLPHVVWVKAKGMLGLERHQPYVSAKGHFCSTSHKV